MASESREYSEKFQKGLELRGEVLGQQYVAKAVESMKDEYWRPAQEYLTEVGWAGIWSRPGLERKQRSLLNIAFLTTLKSWPELALHTRGALRNGLTEIEIREAVLQAMVYVGAPTGVEAMRVTSKAIQEWKEDHNA